MIHIAFGITLTILLLLIYLGGIFMAALDDLTASVTSLEAATTEAVNKVNQLKATPGVDPAQVEALVARINTVVSNLKAAVA